MNDTAIILTVMLTALVGFFTGVLALFTLAARALASEARSAVGLAQAQLQASRRLHSDDSDIAEAVEAARELARGLQAAPGSLLGDVSPLAQAHLVSHPEASPGAIQARPGAPGAENRPTRRPCGLCAQLRAMFAWK